jgi:N-carbamoylputrescine amidase
VRIALVQQRAGRDKAENVRRGLAALAEAARRGAGLVLFAELAFEPFHPQRPARGDVRELAEPVPGPTTRAFAARAAELGVVVVLNLYERAGDRCFDCSPVIDADGRMLGRTRMVHIADYEGFHERGYYAPGDGGVLVHPTRAGRVGVAICYDRHFPEYLRALALGGAELVVVPQAGVLGEWPDGLFEAEMRVAAFQNGYHVALCNRVGREERLEFGGESFVCGPDGRVIARAPAGAESLLVADLDLPLAAESHARRLFFPDRRPDLYAEWFALPYPTAAPPRVPARPVDVPLRRCRIREWRRDDRGSLVRHADNRNVWRNLRDVFPHPYTPVHADTWIALCESRAFNTVWAIEVDGEAAGGIGLVPGRDVNRRSAEIGFWLGEPCWGRGIMTEAVGAVTRMAFDLFGFDRIHADVFEWNAASIRVLEKNGYALEGRLRRAAIKDGRVGDQLVYARLRE